MPVDVNLAVDGRVYTGWDTVEVTRSIEALSGDFRLTVSDRDAGDAEPWPIAEGAECAISIAGETVITGIVDRRSASFSATSHSLEVAGRDKTADLVDCSVRLGKWEFAKQRIDKIVSSVCDQFGIPVSVASGLVLPETREKFSVNHGDTAWEVIDRACRLAGVLAMSDGKGGLVLTRTPAVRAATSLVQGENIKSASVDADGSGRFRTYYAVGQAPGSDESFGAEVAHIEAKATDDGARAGRVLIVQVEGNANLGQAQERANWEAAVRAARAMRATVVVQHWRQGDGSLWPVNAIVPVRAPWLGISGDMLIVSTRFLFSLDSGTEAEIELARPDAFLPEPVIPKQDDADPLAWSDFE